MDIYTTSICNLTVPPAQLVQRPVVRQQLYGEDCQGNQRVWATTGIINIKNF